MAYLIDNAFVNKSLDLTLEDEDTSLRETGVSSFMDYGSEGSLSPGGTFDFTQWEPERIDLLAIYEGLVVTRSFGISSVNHC